jgi:hypothetical protein
VSAFAYLVVPHHVRSGLNSSHLDISKKALMLKNVCRTAVGPL